MKLMEKRKALMAAVAVCLVALLAIGTLAIFTARDSITNTFLMTSNNPEDPDDELFSIRIYETAEDGGQTTEGRTYQNIAPGDVLDKDPTVQNTGQYGQWIRMMITLTNAQVWQEICEAHQTDLPSMLGGYDENTWTRYDEPVYDAAADTLTYTFYLDRELDVGEAATLFTTLTIPGSFDLTDMNRLNTFQISVSADAIQSAHTGSNAKDAFDMYWK